MDLMLLKHILKDFSNKVFSYLSEKLENFVRPIRRLFKRIYYVFTWVPFLWKHDDYDYGYLLKLIEYQLIRIRDHIIKHHIHTDDSIKQTTKEINTCLKHLEDMRKDSYDLCEKEWNAHEKKWGELIWWTADRDMNKHKSPFKNKSIGAMVRIERENVKTEKDKAQEAKESRKLYKLQQKREEEAGVNFMKAFLKHYKGWWC